MNPNFDIYMSYNQALMNYEEFIKGNANNEKGYLIKLEDFKRIKELTSYDDYKYDLGRSEMKLSFSEEKISQIKKIEKVNITSLKGLIVMINKGNEYQLITENLYKVLSDDSQDETPFVFSITDSKIIINEKIYFNEMKISRYSLSYDSYNIYHSFIDEIEKVCKSIIKYYEFEFDFINRHKNEYGYFISKKWIDEWKKLSNYEEIKKKYLNENNLKEENIINELINTFKENTICKLSPLKYVNYEDEIKSFLEKDSLVIVNSDFLYQLDKSTPLSICYEITGNTIKLGYNKMNFIINENIISCNESDMKSSFNDKKDNYKYIPILNHQINSNYYQYEINDKNNEITNISEKLKTLIKLSIYQHNFINFNSSKKIEPVFLLNKKWLENYSYDKIYSLINENYEIINDINNINTDYFYNDCNIINNIISKIQNKSLLLDIDKKVTSTIANTPFEAPKKTINLLDYKKILIFQNILIKMSNFYLIMIKVKMI